MSSEDLTGSLRARITAAFTKMGPGSLMIKEVIDEEKKVAELLDRMDRRTIEEEFDLGDIIYMPSVEGDSVVVWEHNPHWSGKMFMFTFRGGEEVSVEKALIGDMLDFARVHAATHKCLGQLGGYTGCYDGENETMIRLAEWRKGDYRLISEKLGIDPGRVRDTYPWGDPVPATRA